jgi:hypothetical protein
MTRITRPPDMGNREQGTGSTTHPPEENHRDTEARRGSGMHWRPRPLAANDRVKTPSGVSWATRVGGR